MSPLLLLLIALFGAVLIQAFIRVSVAPHRRWVSAGRPRVAIARRAADAAGASEVESKEATRDWENEGGAVAVPTERLDHQGPVRRAGRRAADNAIAVKPKAS
jgi:hypothetical protein